MKVNYKRIMTISTAMVLVLSQYNMGFGNSLSDSYSIEQTGFSGQNMMDHAADYEAIISEMSSDSYRSSVEVCDDSVVIIRNETEASEYMEETAWYRECGVKDFEVVSEHITEDGNRVVTYTLKTDGSEDIWKKIDEFNSSDECLMAEPVYIYHNCDMEDIYDVIPDDISGEGSKEMSQQWYLDDQGITSLKRDNSIGDKPSGKDMVIAVIDTGVDYNHEDLADSMWINEAELNGRDGIDDDGNGVVDDIYGASFDDEGGTPMDENGHGTHVAGMIAMSDHSVGGIGLVPNAKIMAVKAAGSDGIFRSTDVAKAIRYAGEMGADVINMSFGSYAHSAVVEEACREAFGKSILVAAAGNESYPTADSPVTAKGNQYPACYSYVLGVMAHDKDHKLASFSNWDYRIGEGPEYEIAAPGVSIYSTLPDNTYGTRSGTSMAAAVVSAAAAVVKSNLPAGMEYSSRYIMEQILEASKQTVGGYKRICLKDCYEYMAALNEKFAEDKTDNEGVDESDKDKTDNDDGEQSDTDKKDSADTEQTDMDKNESAGGGQSDSADNSPDNQTVKTITLDASITEDMTLESGCCYVVDKAVVVEEGVTVNVDPGTKLQFWDGAPNQASTANPFAYIEVKGSMNFAGTKDMPIELFPDKAFGSYRVDIRNSGTVNMEYVSIVNPYISISEGKHLMLSQDYDTVNYRGRDDEGKLHMYKGGSLVEADSMEYSTMSDLRYTDDSVAKSIVNGSFDTVQFDNCRVFFDSVKARNCVFLMNSARIQNQSGGLEYASCDTDEAAGLEGVLGEGSENNVFLSGDNVNEPGESVGVEDEMIYPYVDNIYIIDQYGRHTSAVADGRMELHVLFNRSMSTEFRQDSR